MNYIVIDLEWNQAMSANSPVFNKLPIHLRGEIIQIGAVKLTEDMQPAEEFKIDVKPVYFKRMHYKVKKLTGFDKERLLHGTGFKDAMAQFRAWCGEHCTFLTWGYDDQGVMEQNIIIHDLDWDWIDQWVNLQLIYNIQTDGDKNQKSLATAMEHFGIEQTRTAHDALGDAYNTALVCSHLNMELGMRQYREADALLSLRRTKNESQRACDGSSPISHTTFGEYATKVDAFACGELVNAPCPVCGAVMQSAKWVNQGDQRYMTIATCPEHESYLLRLKFKRTSEGAAWSASRLIYPADEVQQAYYRAKAAQGRRRGKRRAAARGK